jgi:taurine transport system substrate-binding protein
VKQLDIDSAEAVRQLDEIELLDGQQQSGNEYFGNPKAPGLLAAHLRAVALFLAWFCGFISSG